MSGVERLAQAETRGLKVITNKKLREEGVCGEKEKKGELY